MEESRVYIPSRRRLYFAAVITIFVIFFARLIQLQVLYEDVYGEKSRENSIRQIARDPLRGYVYDRHGTVVVDNRPSYTVTITPSEFRASTLTELASVLKLDPDFIKQRIAKGRQYNRFVPTKIKRDVDFPMLSFLEENRSRFPGVSYQIETKRFYPTKAKAPHLFGYTKEVSDAQVGDLYRPGDIIGTTGLEAAYERYLRGRKGIQMVTVNARGEMLGSFNEGKNDVPLQEGDDLILTLDAELQAFAESLMTDRHGAIVAIDPADGGILALVSKPDYDLDYFGSVTPREVWQQLNTDPGKPLFNRATMTRYPPGSTYKMVLAAAALQEGVIRTDWHVQCNGVFPFGTRVFKDLHVHGYTGIVESIQRSCNVYYYTLMLKTGFELWTQYGREFGFGRPTGIDIIEENSGLLPSSQYFDRVYGKGRWTQGYLVSLSIGQGELGVSPLQMACYAMTLGNKGFYHRPHVVQRIRNKDTNTLLDTPRETRTLNISNEVWELIREGLYRCVNVPGGTALSARVPGIDVAGKTGTAQNPHGRDHAWFVGFAPKDNPTIAICVLVENAGFGGAVAAPIAGLCIEKYIYRTMVRGKTQQTLAVRKEEAAANAVPQENDQ
jgi:penicillin-binding protein 2